MDRKGNKLYFTDNERERLAGPPYEKVPEEIPVNKASLYGMHALYMARRKRMEAYGAIEVSSNYEEAQGLNERAGELHTIALQLSRIADAVSLEEIAAYTHELEVLRNDEQQAG